MHRKHNHDHGIDKKEEKTQQNVMEKVNFLLQINECKELPCILVHLLKYQSNGNDGFSQKCFTHDDTVHLELHVAVR